MIRRLTLLALAAAFLLTATPLWADQDCSEMLEQNCTSCHYNNRICKKVGTKNKRSWKNTVKRMVRYGLKLDSSELSKVTNCLADLEENSGKFCD